MTLVELLDAKKKRHEKLEVVRDLIVFLGGPTKVARTTQFNSVSWWKAVFSGRRTFSAEGETALLLAWKVRQDYEIKLGERAVKVFTQLQDE